MSMSSYDSSDFSRMSVRLGFLGLRLRMLPSSQAGQQSIGLPQKRNYGILQL